MAYAFGKKYQPRNTLEAKVSSSENKDAANNSVLQTRLDEFKNQAVIGLEYVIEVHFASNFECVYHCVLCEGRFDPTTVISHLTAFNHRLKYLEKHFPTAFNEISDLKTTEKRELKLRLTEKVCEGIEDQFGRLSVLVVNNSEFTKDRMQVTEKALNSKHIDEYMGCTFIDLIRHIMRKSTVTEKEKNLSDFSDFDEEELRSRRASLDPISTSSESYRSTSVISLSSCSQSLHLTSSPSSGSSKAKSTFKTKILCNAEAFIANSERVQQQTYEMEKLKLLMDEADKALKKKYEEYKDKPLTHPGYKDEWDLFWRRRFKELKALGQPAETHDFKSEWIIEWKQLMERRLQSDIESKKNEIKQKFIILNKDALESGKFIEKLSKKMNEEKPKHEKCKKEKSSSRKLSEARSTKKFQSSKSCKSVARRSLERSCSPRKPLSRRRRSRSKSRSPRCRRSPRRSVSPLSRHSPRRSDSNRKIRSSRTSRSRRSTRSPRRSRSPRRLRSIRRSRSRSPQRTTRKSRTPTRTNAARNNQSSPEYRKKNTSPSYGRKRSPKLQKHEQSKSPRASLFPWTRRGRASVSPDMSKAKLSPKRIGKAIQNRRYTSHFSATTVQQHSKLCAPVPPRIKIGTDSNEHDEPLTIISVLSLLTALEDILGSLGPKVIQLMLQAKAMDKAEDNSSYQLLDNHDHCILFETIKEKLKGLISANLVEANKVNAVKKAIKNMANLVHQTNERQKACEKLQEVGVTKPVFRMEIQQGTILTPEKTQSLPPPPVVTKVCVPEKSPCLLVVSEEERKVIKAKLSAALITQGRTDITDKQMEDLVEAYLMEVEKKKSIEIENSKSKSDRNSNELIEKENKKVPSVDSHVVSTRSDSPLKAGGHSKLHPIAQSVPSSSVAVSLNRPTTSSSSAVSLYQPTTSSSLRQVVPTTITRPTNKNVPTAKPIKILKICPPPIMDGEAVTLSDSDLKILMRKFDVLSKSERENYLFYMEKLKLTDPGRFDRLNSENQKSKENNVVVSTDDKNEDDTTKDKGSIDDGSDSDDIATLASSIANTQQQIAKMNRDLNPIGSRIPVIGSIQTSAAPLQKNVQHPIRIETLCRPQVNPNAMSAAILPPVYHHQEQQQYQHHVFQPHQQQIPYQYQQYRSRHPVPQRHTARPPPQPVQPPHANFYQQPPHPTLYHPRY